MRVMKEETFGPMAPILRFGTEADVVRMANDTEFGLAAYFYSRDIGRVWRVAEGLEYGIVGIKPGIISNEVEQFGGMKESGVGSDGSKYGIEDYVGVKLFGMVGQGGPMEPICRVLPEADGVRMSKYIVFGLAAYCFSREIRRVWRVAEGLEYGIVGINTGIISTEVAPFGGMKESGVGRQGSKYGIEYYVDVKYLCMGVL